MRLALCLTLVFLATNTTLHAAEPTKTLSPEQVAFFEKKIRPVLLEHCNQCHSAEAAAKNKLKGGLILDSREALLAGGDSGAAIVPGKAAESLLIKTMRYDDDVRMPPKGKLSDAIVADFEQWVKMGAPDPRTSTAVKKQVGLSFEEGRKFWSYRPIQSPPAPAVKDTTWTRSEIDRFILAALEAKNLKPAADADRATLARRVYFDLIGLPPTPEQIDAFVNDQSPGAYEKLVDSLLASPQFGERWGRHWLDVVRFAESVTLRGLVFKEAWRYRDYVMDSLNRDVPFDRFLKEQLAGDLLPAASPADKRRQIIATTYLALGNHNLEEQDKKQLRMDVVDEQLDVIGKGLLAQTITCARCHDHKFDPIPTKDYYSLAGILRNAQMLDDDNVSRWKEVPLPGGNVDEVALKKHTQQMASLETRIASIKAASAKTVGKAKPAGSVLAVKDVPGIVVDDTEAKKVGEWTNSTSSKNYIGEGYVHDDNKEKGEKTITFDPEIPVTGRYEVWLAYSAGGTRAENVPVTVFSAEGEKTITVNMKDSPPIEGRFLSLGTYRFERTGQSYVLISNEGTKGHVTADAITFLPADEAANRMAKAASTTGTQAQAPTIPSTASAAATELRRLEGELKKLTETGPKTDKSMSVVEEKKIEETRIHVRGLVHNLGEPTTRGFLRVATYGDAPTMPRDQSGRVQLAEWITSKDNPLTARVIVNRAWLWLFGDGLVRTADNFGTTGELPSNPELLDHLASKFMAEGWSMKGLVRSLVLSRAYQQSSTAERDALMSDPENRLFGRSNRRRLDAECIRDATLSIAGTLTAFTGGPSYPPNQATDYNFKPSLTFRSVYLPMFRNSVPEMLEAFDFADVSMVTGKRNTSTVAPQALFMMNNPFAVAQAKASAARLLAEKWPGDAERVTRAYRLTLGREPTEGERSVTARFLADRSGDPATGWATVFQALFASADFRYVP